MLNTVLPQPFLGVKGTYFIDLASLKRRDQRKFNAFRVWLSKVAENGSKGRQI